MRTAVVANSQKELAQLSERGERSQLRSECTAGSVYCVSHLVCSFFFFSSRRRHTRFDCDWSSDVCSSDLGAERQFLISYPPLLTAYTCAKPPSTNNSVPVM